MRKINGNEITSVEMAQEFIDGIKETGIKLLIAFVVSWASFFFFSKAIDNEEATIWIVGLLISTAAVWWLVGLDKMIGLIKSIPKAAKKGWNTGKEFHSIILAVILGYAYFAAVVAYIGAYYVILPAVGVVITMIRTALGYLNAKKYLAEA